MTSNQNKDIKYKAIIMIVIMLCLLMMGLSGCKPKALSNTKETITKDSVFTSVNYIKRDTTIVVPGDTLSLRVPIYSLSEIPTTIKTFNGTTLSLQKLNDEILAQCNREDLKKIITLLERENTHYRSRLDEISETQEVPIKFTPKWVKVLAWIGAVTVIYSVFWIGRKTVRV